MRTDRFNQGPVLRAHWRALGQRAPGARPRPDWLARTLLLLLPAAAVAATIGFRWRLNDPSPLLAGVALLVGSLVGVFALLATWRQRLTDRITLFERADASARKALDEAAAHILVSILASVLATGLLAVGSSARRSGQPVNLLFSAAIYGACTYLLLVFLILVPALYSAYVYANPVSEDMSGFSQSQNSRRLPIPPQPVPDDPGDLSRRD